MSLRLFASRMEEITVRAEGGGDYVISSDRARPDENRREEDGTCTEEGVWTSLPVAVISAARATWRFSECHGPATAAADAASSAHRQATDAEVLLSINRLVDDVYCIGDIKNICGATARLWLPGTCVICDV